MTHTAIVILNWNGKHHLQRFLPTIAEHTPEWAEIFVADNGSTDGSVEYIKEQLQEDIANDQLTLKEYIDPFTGSKNTKA